MKEKIINLMHKKLFHLCVIIIIIVTLLFILGMTILKYNVEGETNMPFELTKIAIISSSEGIDKENSEAKWDFTVNQNNDIYLYIEKNKNYSKTEVIDSVVINNFNFEKQNPIGEMKIYKPDSIDQNRIFKTNDENKVDLIEYIGDINSNIKDLKMSNQGDVISFRISNNNLNEYISNDEEVINHNDLLKKINLTNEDLKVKVSFDITIKLKSGKEFQSNINLDTPVGDVVQNGTTSTEITDLTNFIFKRVKN